MKDVLYKVEDICKNVIYILARKQRIQGAFLLVLTFIGALFEMLGVTSVIPLMQAFISPEVLLKNAYFSNVFKILGVNEKNVVLAACIFVVLIYLIKNVYLIFLLNVRAHYAADVMRKLSARLINSYMRRDYQYYLSADTGGLLQRTRNNVQQMERLINYGIRLIAEIMTTSVIVLYLFCLDAKIAAIIIIIALVCVMGILVIYKNQLKKLGRDTQRFGEEAYEKALEIFGGIKEIFLAEKREYFVKRYRMAYDIECKAQAKATVAQDIPMYLLEGICATGVILAVGLRISNVENPADYISYLAAFAMAAFRLMPSMGRVSGYFNAVFYTLPMLNEICDRLKETEYISAINPKLEIGAGTDGISYKAINVGNVVFKYGDELPRIIDELSLHIERGSSVGIIGESGTGKSTLMDIILGLLHPSEGFVAFDGKNIEKDLAEYHRHIAYVPQSIYILNDTLRRNVAFGIDDEVIDEAKVWECLEAAKIADYVRTLPDGLDTICNERGVRFSGGQRQRIAIARALYNNPEVIVFDEATSALDNETEESVMNAIEELFGNKTVIIVAHRLTTVKNCDTIYEIKDGKAYPKEKADLGF